MILDWCLTHKRPFNMCHVEPLEECKLIELDCERSRLIDMQKTQLPSMLVIVVSDDGRAPLPPQQAPRPATESDEAL